MSLIVNDKVKAFRAEDPRMKLAQPEAFLIEQGPQNASWQPITTQSYSDSQINFIIVPPSKSTVVSRHMKLSVPFSCAFTGTSSPSVPILGLTSGSDSLRCLPLSSVISNVNVQLNNASFSYVMSDSVKALLFYRTSDKDQFLSTSPFMFDQSQEYESLLLSNRNPLSPYSVAQPHLEYRGSFNQFFASVTNTSASASFTVVINEDLYISPLLFSNLGDESRGFIGLDNIQITLQLGDLTRILSHAVVSGVTVSTVAVHVSGPPSLYVTYLTPAANTVIPKEISYSFAQVINYSTLYGNVAPLGTFQVTSNNIQLSQIPRMIGIYARRSNNTANYNTTDTFAYLSQLSINYNNKVGLLSTAQPAQLYDIACRNGLRQVTWPMWATQVGSVLMIDPVADLGLSLGEAPGLVNWAGNLQITAQFQNLSALNTINYTMYVIIITDGVVTISDGSVIQQIGVVSREDVLERAPELKMVDSRELRNAEGGDFLGTIKNIGKFIKDNKLISKIAKAIPHPAAQAIGSVADTFGVGKMSKAALMKQARRL